MIENPHEIIAQIQAEAFQNGWNALAIKIKEALSQQPTKPLAVKKTEKKAVRSGTATADVYAYVKANPGLTGVEIINGSKVENKAGRTALHRMKIKGIAINENGKWRIA